MREIGRQKEKERKSSGASAAALVFTSVELLLFSSVFLFFLGATEQCFQTTKRRSVDIGQWAFFGDTNNAFTNSFQSHRIDVYILFLFSIVLRLIIHDSTAAGMTVWLTPRNHQKRKKHLRTKPYQPVISFFFLLLFIYTKRFSFLLLSSSSSSSFCVQMAGDRPDALHILILVKRIDWTLRPRDLVESLANGMTQSWT